MFSSEAQGCSQGRPIAGAPCLNARPRWSGEGRRWGGETIGGGERERCAIPGVLRDHQADQGLGAAGDAEGAGGGTRLARAMGS